MVLDITATVATAVAAVLAYITIRQAKKQSAEASAALLTERVVEFRLHVLRELAEANIRSSNVSFASETVRVLASMLPRDLVPLTRAACNLPTTTEAKQRMSSISIPGGSSSRDVMKPAVDQEIASAIQATLRLRSGQVSAEYQKALGLDLEVSENAYY